MIGSCITSVSSLSNNSTLRESLGHCDPPTCCNNKWSIFCQPSGCLTPPIPPPPHTPPVHLPHSALTQKTHMGQITQHRTLWYTQDPKHRNSAPENSLLESYINTYTLFQSKNLFLSFLFSHLSLPLSRTHTHTQVWTNPETIYVFFLVPIYWTAVPVCSSARLRLCAAPWCLLQQPGSQADSQTWATHHLVWKLIPTVWMCVRVCV